MGSLDENKFAERATKVEFLNILRDLVHLTWDRLFRGKCSIDFLYSPQTALNSRDAGYDYLYE
jgi:hypothetical protein